MLTEGPGPSADPDATAGGTDIRTDRDNDPFTQAGAVLGTPAYMPPEQAIGAVDEIDARSDVFGLGGVLAAVLTGAPPFQGETRESTRQMAARGEVDNCFQRLDASGADPELVSLCKRCLAPRKADRPADAGAVAKAVAHLRAAADERARRAELDRARAETVAAEQRKRRRVQLALSSIVVLILAAGSTGTAIGLLNARQARDDEAVQRVRAEGAEAVATARLGELERAAAELRNRNAELTTARQASETARAAAEASDRTTRAALDSLAGDVVKLLLQQQAQLDESQKAFLRRVEKLFATFATTQGNTPQARLDRINWEYQIATIRYALGERTEPERAFARAQAALSELVDDPVVGDEARKQRLRVRILLGESYLNQAKRAEAERLWRQTMEDAEVLHAKRPDDPIARHNLATTLLNLGNQIRLQPFGSKESDALYRRALPLLEGLEEPQSRLYLSSCYNNLAITALQQNRGAEAEPLFRKALEMREQLVKERPSDPVRLDYLANTLGNLGLGSSNPADKETYHRRAFEVRERLVALYPGEPRHRMRLAFYARNLNEALAARGAHERVVEVCDKVLVTLALPGAPPDVVEPLRRFERTARGSRAVSLGELGRHAEAAAEWDRLLAITPKDEAVYESSLRAIALVRAGQLDRGLKEADACAESAREQPRQRALRVYYNAACAYAVASDKAPERRPALAERSMELLRKSIDAGWDDAAHLKADADLAPLRARPDFKKLATDLEKQFPPKPATAPPPRPRT